MKRLFLACLSFLCAAVLGSISLSTNSSRAADGPKLAVAYSSNILGYLEPCG